MIILGLRYYQILPKVSTVGRQVKNLQGGD